MSEDLYIIDNSGRRRKAIQKICLSCEREYLVPVRFGNRSKYCSPKCCGDSTNTKVLVNCSCCHKPVYRKLSTIARSSYGVFYCSKTCHNLAQRTKTPFDVVLPSHYKDGKYKDYRSIAKDLLSSGCVGCGEYRVFLLMVHHIDGDRGNSELSNLESVCGRCHMTRHLRHNGHNWIYCPKSLTPRNIVLEMDAISKNTGM